MNLRAIKVRELEAGMLLCLNNFRYVKVGNVKETEVGNSLVTVKGVMEDELFFADDYVVIVSDEAIGEPVEIVTADMLMDGWVVFDNFLTGYVCGGFGDVFVLNVERPLIEGDEGAVILQVGGFKERRVPSKQHIMVLSR
ncbi:hypothetical protein [uncultured Rothia sp.]|uniref:hypothetical protein n=1 Tax=uncultured Rothia sp. TaxID=316088 RepID=UPI0028DB18EF|nr:hypothetical protein [uncultured Rothia sp.]